MATVATEPAGPVSASYLAERTHIPSLSWGAHPQAEPRGDEDGPGNPKQQSCWPEGTMSLKQILILSSFFHSTELWKICPVPGTLPSTGVGPTGAKQKVPCPCGADTPVEKRVSKPPANKRKRLVQVVISTTKATRGVLGFPFLPLKSIPFSDPHACSVLWGSSPVDCIPGLPCWRLRGFRQQGTGQETRAPEERGTVFLLLPPPCLAAWVCNADPSVTEPPVSPGSDSTPSSRVPKVPGC